MVTSKLSNFYIRSSLFIVLSLSAAALNYLLYIVLAHVLSVRDFGDFAAIIAISNQVLGILLALNLTSIYLVKNNDATQAKYKAQVIQKIVVWVFIGLIIIVSFFWSFIAEWLKIKDPISFAILVLILLASIPSVIWTGYLQGHKKLIDVGVYNFSASVFKFIFSLALGVIGGTVGGLTGVLLGVIFGLIILRLITKIELPSIRSVFSKLVLNEKMVIKDLHTYIMGSIIVVGLLSIMLSIDIIYAKALFNPEIAGAYSGISILSSAIYYIALMIVWIILPEIAVNNPIHNKRLLRTSYKLLGGLALAIISFEAMFKDKIVTSLLGDQFRSQADLLVYISLYQISLVCITLYAYYLLILRSNRAFILGLCVLIPIITLPWLFGATPKKMIVSLYTSILLGAAAYFIINIVLKATIKNAEKAS